MGAGFNRMKLRLAKIGACPVPRARGAALMPPLLHQLGRGQGASGAYPYGTGAGQGRFR